MKLPISVIILTYNEELNLPNCLGSIADWADEIFVVDSHSTDSTAQIAKRYGARIVEHPFENQARQFNWALDNLDIKNDWILRLDADEYLTEELKKEISDLLTEENIRVNPRINPRLPSPDGSGRMAGTARQSASINGYYIKRRVYFMGRWIKHGGYYPTWLLRLFRKGKARSEDREMDEHIVLLEGQAEYLKNDFIDDNQKGLSFWIEKHNQFASREVKEVMKTLGHKNMKKILDGPPAQRRFQKERYYRLPIFFRAFLYFLNRYFLRLGFLDGIEGLIFHVLQGFWYRFLVDSKLYEQARREISNPKHQIPNNIQ